MSPVSSTSVTVQEYTVLLSLVESRTFSLIGTLWCHGGQCLFLSSDVFIISNYCYFTLFEHV